MTLFFQYFGSALGVLGAFLLAVNTSYSWMAWPVWLCSNILLVIWAFSIHAWGLLGMQIIFTGTSVLGLLRMTKKRSG